MAAYQSELAVITKAKDLCSYVMTVTDKSPKRFRFTLVAKLQNYALDIIENLYRANEAFVKAGDRVSLDNSDYLAAQTYYRHQTPEGHEFIGWEQFKTAQGTPVYPVREYKAGPPIARGSCGSLQSGNFRGKMIVVAATMDESAFPWQIDWYRQKVKEQVTAVCRDSLIPYSVPRFVEVLDKMPRTPLGKIDYRSLENK